MINSNEIIRKIQAQINGKIQSDLEESVALCNRLRATSETYNKNERKQLLPHILHRLNELVQPSLQPFEQGRFNVDPETTLLILGLDSKNFTVCLINKDQEDKNEVCITKYSTCHPDTILLFHPPGTSPDFFFEHTGYLPLSPLLSVLTRVEQENIRLHILTDNLRQGSLISCL